MAHAKWVWIIGVDVTTREYIPTLEKLREVRRWSRRTYYEDWIDFHRVCAKMNERRHTHG